MYILYDLLSRAHGKKVRFFLERNRFLAGGTSAERTADGLLGIPSVRVDEFLPVWYIFT